MFLIHHSNLFWQVEEIREMVDNDLGFQQTPLMCYSRTKTLLFISNDKKVIGCLIAEHIQWVSNWSGERQFVSVLSDRVLQTFWNYRITREFKSSHLANKYSMYAFSREEKTFGGGPCWNVTVHFCLADTELRHVYGVVLGSDLLIWALPIDKGWNFFFLCSSSPGPPLSFLTSRFNTLPGRNLNSDEEVGIL